MALRDKLTLAGKTRSRVFVFGSFFPHYVQLLLFFGSCFFSFLSVSGGSLSGFWFFLEIAVAQASRQTAKKKQCIFWKQDKLKGVHMYQ